MKKITFILSCLIGSVGVMQAQQVQIPAAYSNLASVLEQDHLVQPENSQARVNLDSEIPFTGTYGDRRTDLIYDNGPHYNTPATGGGANISLLENATLGMTTLGAGVQYSGGNSIADEFILTDAYDVTSIDLYTYQTGSVPPSITEVYVQIWDGDPSGDTANVVWGNLSVDILEDVVSANTYRASETSATDTSRPIQKVTAATDNLTLGAGTYWIEFSLAGSGASGPWAPPIAILGEATTGNALQFASGAWQALVDGGSFTPQGIPFQIYGTRNLSVQENALQGFSFYPNPTSDMLNLSANKNIEFVSLFNLLGQKVMTVKVDATTSAINLSGLSSGAYMMEVSVNGQKGAYKIMKN